MKELSLNILDVAKNSVTAGATKIGILVEETPGRLTITITDNGCGMTPGFVRQVTDPFTTTRTTRKVGLGLSPVSSMAAQMTGGHLFHREHAGRGHHGHTPCSTASNMDLPPLGDLAGAIAMLIQGSPGD